MRSSSSAAERPVSLNVPFSSFASPSFASASSAVHVLVRYFQMPSVLADSQIFSPSPGDSSGASSSSSDSSAASASPSSSSDDAASSGAPSSSSPGVSEGARDADADVAAAAAAAAAEEANDEARSRMTDDSAYEPGGDSQSACVYDFNQTNKITVYLIYS